MHFTRGEIIHGSDYFQAILLHPGLNYLAFILNSFDVSMDIGPGKVSGSLGERVSGRDRVQKSSNV